MNFGGWLLWGFVGTIVMTTLMSASQGLRLTRISLPYMLGTMVTPSRDRFPWGCAVSASSEIHTQLAFLRRGGMMRSWTKAFASWWWTTSRTSPS